MEDDQQQPKPEVATHVLVPEEHAERLRKLAARTRVNQSEYLREAVDDLLSKYAENELDAPELPVLEAQPGVAK